MAETISTGSVAQTGSRTYIVGTASGIDTTALVDAAYAQKTAVADSIDVKISDNTDKISAYTDLQSLTESLQASLESLKSYYGTTTADESIYDTKMAYIATSDSSVNTDNLLSMSVDDDAENGSYQVTIEQVATVMKVASNSQTSKTDALGIEGDFAIGLGDGESVTVTVSADQSLEDIVSSINALTEDSGVSASIIKTGDSSYSLVLAGQNTAEEISYESLSGDDVFSAIGLIDETGSFVNVTQAAQEAIITIDGLQVTSSTNVIEDAIEGVTFSLVGASPGTTMTLDIDYDYSGLKDAITSFVEAYNALREFVINQSSMTTDEETGETETATLFSDTIMKSLSNELSNIVSTLYASGSLSTLANIGITYDENNYLEISDETALNNALLSNYEDVQALFQTSVEISSDSLSVLRNETSSDSLSFVLDIEVDDTGAITSVSVNGDENAFTVSGTRLIGQTGTVYEGLTLVYSGTESASVSVEVTQGLADRLYNAMEAYTSDTDGVIQGAIEDLDGRNSTLETEASRIRERADAYREKLIEKYAAMESNISAAELLLKQVQAILGTGDDDD